MYKTLINALNVCILVKKQITRVALHITTLKKFNVQQLLHFLNF